MGEPNAHAHSRQGHQVSEYLNAGMDIYHSLEMTQSDEERASGEENDKGQAHDCAMCYGHMMHMGQKRDKGIVAFLCARILGARNGACWLVSIGHLTIQEEMRPY